MSRWLSIRALVAVLALPAVASAAPTGTISGKVEATPEKYLADTVVYVKEAPGDHAPRTLKVDQKGMTFIPRILLATVGDTVQFLNSDRVDHNVYTPDGEAYNLGMFPKGQSREHKFTKAGTYTQLCSVHPEMIAYIFVGQNPYAAVVKKDGTYTIENVPPGNYEVAVWNPKLKAEAAPVVVEAGKSAKADFTLAR
jgi:plastocyanin